MSLENDGAAEKDGVKPRRIHLREISGDSEAPLETVGQDLRAARLRRGDEIAQVSRALKIRKDHLEALENDRLEDLPGKTYAIGFVRSYSRHLGLDSAAYVERFKQDISGRPEEQKHEPAAIHQDERRLPQGWRIIAGVVVMLLGYGVYHLFSSGGEGSQPVPPPPVLNAPKPKPAPPPQPVVIPAQEATPSPAADDSGSGAAVPATADAPAGQVATAMPPPAAGPQSPATRSGPHPNTPVTAQQTPAPADQAAVPAVAAQTYGAAGRSRVVLRARGDTVVTVKSPDGQMMLNRMLKAGDVYQVPATPGLTFATSDAGAVEVDLDGIALGRAGQPSQVLGRVSLDPKSLADRFNSH